MTRGMVGGGVTGGLPALGADLELVGSELLAATDLADPTLAEIARHLVAAGGRPIRSLLALAASMGADPTSAPATPEARTAAVAVELVHVGSLVHDDVIRSAKTRRSVASVNARWGNLKAILAGDFLFARASERAAELGTEIAELLAGAIATLCEGHVLEVQARYDTDRTIDSYLRSVRGKRAALFATACRMGAIAGDRPSEETDAVTEFGGHFGMAHQLADDIAAVREPGDQHAFASGVYTLPVLHALAGNNGDRLRSVLGRAMTRSEIEETEAIVGANGALATATGTVRTEADKAIATLDRLGDSPSITSLRHETERLAEIG